MLAGRCCGDAYRVYVPWSDLIPRNTPDRFCLHFSDQSCSADIKYLAISWNSCSKSKLLQICSGDMRGESYRPAKLLTPIPIN